jgi:hypothetical protein
MFELTSILTNEELFGRILRVGEHLQVSIVDAGRKVRHPLFLFV